MALPSWIGVGTTVDSNDPTYLKVSAMLMQDPPSSYIYLNRKTVRLLKNGVQYGTGVTDGLGSGWYEWDLSGKLPNGTYTFQTIFDGDAEYGPSQSSVIDHTVYLPPPDGDGPTPPPDYLKLLPIVIIGAAALGLLYLDSRTHGQEKEIIPMVDTPTAGKEEPFLQYNKEEMFKGFLAAEGHLRNVGEPQKKRKEMSAQDIGFLNCVVKHAADIESHADEAVSHALVIEGKEKSEKFRTLRDSIRDYRRNLQTGDLSIDQAILEVRGLRRRFESFNPSYDVSKCESCSVEVKVMRDE